MGSRKGFYLYDEKRKARPDPKIKTFIGKAREISGVNFDPKLVNLYEKNMLEMTFPMVNEACRVLAEGIVVKAADLDIAIVMARASHLTEPALGINFARDGMQEDWLALVAVHRDSWLLSVAFYFGSRFGFDKADRVLKQTGKSS